jgi:hypothetical protein
MEVLATPSYKRRERKGLAQAEIDLKPRAAGGRDVGDRLVEEAATATARRERTGRGGRACDDGTSFWGRKNTKGRRANVFIALGDGQQQQHQRRTARHK